MEAGPDSARATHRPWRRQRRQRRARLVRDRDAWASRTGEACGATYL